MPISLYAIIILLVLNMFTGGMWLHSKCEITDLKNQLKSAHEAKKELDLTAEIKTTEDTLVVKTCEQQLQDLRDSYDKAKLRNFQIDVALSQSKESIGNFKTEVNSCSTKLKDKVKTITKIKEVFIKVPGKNVVVYPPTVTYQELSPNEKAIVSDYLSTPVPEFISGSLYIRGVRKDN